MRTEHALDWSKTALEIEAQFEAGMIERDKYRDALENIIGNEEVYNRGDAQTAYIAKTALGIVDA